MNRIAYLTFLSFVFVSVGFFFSKNLFADTTDKTLNNVCNIYSDNWIGLNYHYPKGKKEFLNKCKKSIQGKTLLEGLWSIRSLMPDGHAGFEMITSNKQTLIYPLVFNYNIYSKSLVVAAVFESGLSKYVGKKIASINGKPPMFYLSRRAGIEPQSTMNSSFEVAARTLTYQPSFRPYPNFFDMLNLVFENGTKISLKPISLHVLRKNNANVLSRNYYPSIWGDISINNDSSYCISEDEISKVISFRNSRWLWWHPKSMLSIFKQNGFKCWQKHIKKIDGVIIDLRDTAGGNYYRVLSISKVLGHVKSINIKTLLSPGAISVGKFYQPESTNIQVIKNGYQSSATYESRHFSDSLEIWNGPVVMLTNGICGSACDNLARLITRRQNICSYGTPTAGRANGYTTITIDNSIKIDIPAFEHRSKDNNKWEGEPVIPEYTGGSTVFEALNACIGKISIDNK